jgi:hypothetical protein
MDEPTIFWEFVIIDKGDQPALRGFDGSIPSQGNIPLGHNVVFEGDLEPLGGIENGLFRRLFRVVIDNDN